MWVAVAVELIVLLIFYNNPINWTQLGIFAFTQSTIFQFWTPNCLREYGCGCPNGSLWTICALIQFYFFAYFLYQKLNRRSLKIWIITIIGAIILSVGSRYVVEFMPAIVGKLLKQTLIPYLWMFLIAAFVAVNKEKLLPIIKRYWIAWLLVALIVKYIGIDYRAGYNIIYSIFLFVTVLGIGYSFPRLNLKTDISYDIYIYHMTIVNAMIVLGLKHDEMWLAVVTAITILISWISTVTIGHYAKERKKKMIITS